MGKLKIEIKESYGTCATSLFKKMCEKGDVTSKKVNECVGLQFKLKGYAACHCETDNKSFDVVYYDSNCGIISTGSEGFLQSIKDYLEDVDEFIITTYKAKLGTGYKASPVIPEE